MKQKGAELAIMKSTGAAAAAAKRAGLRDLSHACDITGRGRSYFDQMYRNNRPFFDIVISGCVTHAEQGDKICHDCRIFLGFKTKDLGAHTAIVCECCLCGEEKPILPARHYEKEGKEQCGK